MSVKIDATGRRWVQVEVEVPGTPEEVWQAIATGPGVSSWFVPAQEQEDGSLVLHFGPGMDVVSTRTAWEPPHRFAAESHSLGPDAPAMATEWTVEARSGGTCLVRVVHSLFASTDDWDNQLNGMESGWPSLFLILKIYLVHFRGQPCSLFQVMAVASSPMSQAWDTLLSSLGLSSPAIDQPWNADGRAPHLAGAVDAVGSGTHPFQLLRLTEPVDGVAFFNACAAGPQSFVMLGFYLYGPQAAAIAAREEPLWQQWMSERFPAAG